MVQLYSQEKSYRKLLYFSYVFFFSQGNKVFLMHIYFVFSQQERIQTNYKSIKFRPDQFQNYLLSSDVGFSGFETVGIPAHVSLSV